MENVIKEILLVNFKFKAAITNVYYFPWESDLLLLTYNDFLHEIEIKTGISDWKRDLSKKLIKHKLLNKGSTYNTLPYFSVACPKDTIQLSDVPENYGLFWVDIDHHNYTILREPTQISDVKVNYELFLNKYIKRKTDLFTAFFDLKKRFDKLSKISDKKPFHWLVKDLDGQIYIQTEDSLLPLTEFQISNLKLDFENIPMLDDF